MDQKGIVHIIAIVVVVIVVIVAALAWVIVSSNNSVSEGGSDNSNNNSNSTNNGTLLPGQASALVIVTIHSVHIISGVHYMLYLNSILKADGDLPPGSSLIQTITLFFPQNQTGVYNALISATSSGGLLGGQSSNAVVTPVNGGTYPVTLNV